MCNIRLIIAKSNIELGQLVSSHFNDQTVDIISKQFSNSELKVQIQNCIRNTNVYIIASGSSDQEYSINDYLMELYLLVDACRRSSTASITVILPYYPYSRSDKKTDGRCPISGSVIVNILEKLGTDRVLSMDLHASQIQGFTHLPFDNLEAKRLFVNFIAMTYFGSMTKDEINQKYILVSPDSGGVKRVVEYAETLGVNYVIMHKQRDYTKESVVLNSMLIGHTDTVANKTAIIIDDIVDTMGTMISAANELGTRGVEKVIVMATHGILSGDAIKRINTTDMIQDVVVTNTVPQKHNMSQCVKLKVIDISDLLGDIIRRLDSGESISALF